MTRRPSPAGPLVVLILLCFGASFTGVPAPHSATASPTGVLEPRAGTDLWRSGAPESRAVASFAARSDSGSTPDPATGVPSESPTPRVSPSRFLAGKPKGSAAASPRPSAMRAPRPVASGAPVPATRAPRRPQGGSGGVLLRMTWYCGAGSPCTRGYGPDCACAAISPDLSSWTGRLVRIWTERASVVVRIIDCNCATEHGIDVYRSTFARLVDPSAGVAWVHAEVVG